mmetsp:Transcript_37993/g.77737  ORF Transcript_37993/g.77737 Transcript_37993/m.77737 type:complete len:240 (+) Transcript_37993:1876-2595(+)
MLLHRLLGRSVDRHEDLLCAPVELDIMVSGEGEDHGIHRRLLAFAHEVKVQHTLNSSVLHAVHNRSGLWRCRHECVLGACRRRRMALWRGLLALEVNHLPNRRSARSRQVRLREGIDLSQGHWDHRRDVGLRAVHLDAEAKLVAGSLHLAQAFKVVGTGAANQDLDLVLLDVIGVLLECLDKSCERRSHVREVGDASTNDQKLTLRVLVLHHQGQQGFGIDESFLGGRSSGVLSIVCEL